jgi:hypothetical protein
MIFFEKWVSVGTDSKVELHLKKKVKKHWKKPRSKTGRKKNWTIISSFQTWKSMLMLIKTKGHPLQALFFDWRLLEIIIYFWM